MMRHPATTLRDFTLQAARRRAGRWFSVALLTAGAALVLVAMADPVRRVTPWWDVANDLGLGAFLALGLCFAVGPRPSLPALLAPRLAMRLHRALGYAGGGLVAAHFFAFVYTEPLVLADLTPRAPIGMLAGLAAAVLTVVLLLLSHPPFRPRAHRDAQAFRAAHRLIASVILGAAAYHAIMARFHLDHPAKIVGVIAVLILLLLRPLGHSGAPTTAGATLAPPVLLATLGVVAVLGGLAFGFGLLGVGFP